MGKRKQIRRRTEKKRTKKIIKIQQLGTKQGRTREDKMEMREQRKTKYKQWMEEKIKHFSKDIHFEIFFFL